VSCACPVLTGGWGGDSPSLPDPVAPLERALALRSELRVDPLTAREREVAALLAAGLSNRAIAERLVITEGTTEVHVKHIMTKLGLGSRTQIAVWAAKRGIVSVT